MFESNNKMNKTPTVGEADRVIASVVQVAEIEQVAQVEQEPTMSSEHMIELLESKDKSCGGQKYIHKL